MPTAAVPDYDATLAAFHRACRRELRRAVADLPLPPGGRVLDLPCGDGFYTAILAKRLGPGGRAVGGDLLPAYLKRAAATARKARVAGRCEFVPADAYELPFDDGSFDLVWCAQSFISLDEPVRALAEMRRVLKSGGTLAVLENDEFHHVLLPWPADIEVALQAATLAGCLAKYGRRGKLTVGRRLAKWLRAAGLAKAGKHTYATDWIAPLPAAARAFLDGHLRSVWELTRDHLPRAARAKVKALTDPSSGRYLLDRPEAEVTCLNAVWTATKLAD